MEHRTCSVDGCPRGVMARGWCKMHYHRWYTGRDLGGGAALWSPQEPTCSIDGCEKPTKSRGWCGMHYRRWWRHGDLGGADTVILGPVECRVDGCELQQESNAMCRPHARRDGYLRKNYGITLEDYAEMHKAQGGRCAVCGNASRDRLGRSLHVDHCHATGRIRKLLCGDCNMTLGKVQDDPALLRRLADYIEEHAESSTD